MPFRWDNQWANQPQHNNGATQADIIAVLATAPLAQEADPGIVAALVEGSDQIKVMKGLHQFNPNPHITVEYRGGLWHVDLVARNNPIPNQAWRAQRIAQNP